VGGGLLGLELAASLNDADHEVSIVQLTSRLMERQLDPLAGELLKEVVEEMGVSIHFNDQVQRIFSNKDKDGLEARLKSGKLLKCQAAVYTIGTRPNIEIAQDAGLICKRGVVVNHYMQTSDTDIFAIGEIAEYQNMLYGITASAEQQAEICADFVNGDFSNYYQGSLLMNILKFSNLDLCSMGMVSAPQNNKDYEEILFIDRSQQYYKKCIIYKDRLVGAILMGDKAEFVEFKELIESQVELSEKRIQLLRSGKTMEPVQGKLVCSCNQVGEENLIKEIEHGCNNLEGLYQTTGAGLGCGSCKPEVQSIFREHRVTEPII
jgi:ferredoxin-nitrate reductase